MESFITIARESCARAGKDMSNNGGHLALATTATKFTKIQWVEKCGFGCMEYWYTIPWACQYARRSWRHYLI